MLFRHAEQRDQSVEHVGTWHSHHCNGLRQLSQGDVRGYFKTLTKPAYRLPVFVASLVKEIPTNSSSPGWIDHFLFVKGEQDCFYKITDQIETVDTPSKFSDITGHEKRVPSIPDPTFWYETERGRLTLAEDQQQLRNISGLTTKATRRLGIISIRCQVGHKFMSVSYPERPTDQSVRIEVGVTRSLLSIDCSLTDRQLGFAAGLHALERVEG
jgi:hypothetical protein